MTVTRQELQVILDKYPNINCQWWPMDEKYILPSKQEVEEMLGKTFLEGYNYNLGKFECNDYALICAAFVRQEKYFVQMEAPWAFGMCCGTFPGFSPAFHARNIVILDDEKVYSVEPQTDRLEELNENDSIDFINYL